jgi:hypothetical protein
LRLPQRGQMSQTSWPSVLYSRRNFLAGTWYPTRQSRRYGLATVSGFTHARQRSRGAVRADTVDRGEGPYVSLFRRHPVPLARDCPLALPTGLEVLPSRAWGLRSVQIVRHGGIGGIRTVSGQDALRTNSAEGVRVPARSHPTGEGAVRHLVLGLQAASLIDPNSRPRDDGTFLPPHDDW